MTKQTKKNQATNPVTGKAAKKVVKPAAKPAAPASKPAVQASVLGKTKSATRKPVAAPKTTQSSKLAVQAGKAPKPTKVGVKATAPAKTPALKTTGKLVSKLPAPTKKASVEMVAKVASKHAVPLAKTAPAKPQQIKPRSAKPAAPSKGDTSVTAASAKKKGAAVDSSKVLKAVKLEAAVAARAIAPLLPPAATKPKAGSRVVPSYVPPAAESAPHHGNTAAKASFIVTTSIATPPPATVVKKDPKLVNNWKTKTADQLTDAEVIAMPDGEYMNAIQLAFFRLKLVGLKNGILSNAGETTEHLREDTSVVPDPADRATIEEEHALELRTRDRERKLLKKIEQSISRIDADEYGYCDETGEPIGVARLIARPTATLSLEAQQRRELKQKMFGD